VIVAIYHINVFWSDEDGCYVAGIPELAFRSAYGDTPEEATRQALIVRDAWLESAKEAGRSRTQAGYRPSHAGCGCSLL
jgi:predicted RNase H-like HicB family nuclease